MSLQSLRNYTPIKGIINENNDAQIVRNMDYFQEVAMGRIEGQTSWTKFGYNGDIDTGTEEVVADFGGTFDPATDVITTAQTFTITYNNTTDGSGTTGALSLVITYLDENFLIVQGVHTLGSTGSDVTSFTGLGINRVAVLSSGSAGYNTNTITITATTDGTTQANIPALGSITQQGIFHVPIASKFLINTITIIAGKTSGGTTPELITRGYSWSRVTNTRHEMFRSVFDTAAQNFKDFTQVTPLVISGREIVYFAVTSDTNNAEVSVRFSGIVQEE